MRRLRLTLLSVTLLSFSPNGNKVSLELSEGAAEVEWVSPSTFRFRRVFSGRLAESTSSARKAVPVRTMDSADALSLQTRYLTVNLQKRGLRLRVQKADGTPLMEEPSPAEMRQSTVHLERSAVHGVRYFGLGARAESGLDLRRKLVRADVPFLFSSAGYGEYHQGPGSYLFDMARSLPDRYQINIEDAKGIDCFFYYGPTPKEIFEEHGSARVPIDLLSPDNFEVLRPADVPKDGQAQANACAACGWDGLRDAVLWLVHGSLSGILLPVFNLDSYAGGPAEQRAQQLGTLVPLVTSAKQAVLATRRQLIPYFFAYSEEARERSLPFVRALPLQFPSDPKSAQYSDEFMLGDELLAAPIYTPGSQRTVYLPMGIWTNLDSNETYPGRREIQVSTETLPLFARNGTIVPLGTDPMVLHYFPKLGAEFFIFEDESWQYSEVHAAPAADIMRLQIESKKARDYEWVVHHVERAQRVGFEDTVYAEVKDAGQLRAGTWFYDATKKNLHVRLHAAAGDDRIVNLSFE